MSTAATTDFRSPTQATLAGRLRDGSRDLGSSGCEVGRHRVCGCCAAVRGVSSSFAGESSGRRRYCSDACRSRARRRRGRAARRKCDWVHWRSGTAQLLPRLLKGRTRGPVFLTDRKAPARTPTLDVCPPTGRARRPTGAPPNSSNAPPGRWPTPDSATRWSWPPGTAGRCTSCAIRRSPTKPKPERTPRRCWPAPGTWPPEILPPAAEADQ